MSTDMFKMMRQAMGKKETFEDQINIDDSISCPECGSENIAVKEPHSVNICLDCKCTIGNNLDFRPDWRNDPNGNDMSRCNIPRNELLPESCMSTCIGTGGKNGKLSQDLGRALIWNSVPPSERSMRTKIEDISHVCKQRGIPDAIIEYAHENYHHIIRKLEEEKMKRKRANNDKGLRAAALFISFQDNHKPKTYQEVADIFGIETRYVSAGLTLFNKLLRQQKIKVTKYADYIDEYCDSLNMSAEHKARVAEVVDKVDELGILENNIDTSVVAGCISYVVTEFVLPIKASDIHHRCNVSIPTINKVCDKLTKRSIELINI